MASLAEALAPDEITHSRALSDAGSGATMR
jgi:hypothetical protein